MLTECFSFFMYDYYTKTYIKLRTMSNYETFETYTLAWLDTSSGTTENLNFDRWTYETCENNISNLWNGKPLHMIFGIR